MNWGHIIQSNRRLNIYELSEFLFSMNLLTWDSVWSRVSNSNVVFVSIFS